MKAAIVVNAGEAPVYGDFKDPAPGVGESLIRVTASSISHVTRSRASGTHYSGQGALPLVPGIDGTGIMPDGRRVYFFMPEAPFGAMAEFSRVDDRRCIPLPNGLDDATAAAMAIPAVSSWAALVERAKLRPAETVLINGATGTSGRLAIQVAKHLGAGKVIATGRQVASFDDLRRLGADVTVPLIEDRDALEASFKREFELGIDVVLDYLWGASAETLIIAAAKAGPEGVPIRYIEIGGASGGNVMLPGAALRSSSLQLMGSGLGSIAFPALLEAMRGVLTAAPSAGFEVAIKTMPLANVATAWEAADTGPRIVLVP
jgi:NADPH:quinone reductase-like Zn-dependent oxidoreductase